MRHKRYIFLFILTVSVSLLVIGCVYNVISGKPWYANIMVQFFLNLPLCIGLGFIDFGVINLIYKRLKQRNNAVRILVVAVTNFPKHDFNRCKSVIYKFLSRDTKSARDKNGTKPRKNKVKNTSPEISLVEYLCFVCKGTNLSLEKRGEIPISLIHNSFSYHCTPNVVIASDFDLKQYDLQISGVKFCFSLCWTFSKTRTGNRTKDLPPLLSNPWFCECLNDRHLKMLNFK